MVSLADKLGMQDYHTLYDDGVNAKLKGKRPNPNQLWIGDEWNDPPKGQVFPKPVDKTHVFVVKPKKPPKLRIVLVDAEHKPLAGKAWKLITPKALTGKTKKDGLIEIPDFPFQDKAGSLEVTWQVTKPKKPAKPPTEPVITKPTYPRPIKASEFIEDPPAAPSAADDVVQFTLKIGSLPPFSLDFGVRARLHNLGYGCNRGADTEHTKKCVAAYQRAFLKQQTPSGKWQDIRDNTRDKHDNP
jgi:hypothetical protein